MMVYRKMTELFNRLKNLSSQIEEKKKEVSKIAYLSNQYSEKEYEEKKKELSILKEKYYELFKKWEG